MTTTPDTPFRQCGSTDLASFTRAIQRTVSSGVSPMSKDANLIFSTLQAAGLDRLGAAMAWHETKNGTWPGPIPFNYHNPWAMVSGVGSPNFAADPAGFALGLNRTVAYGWSVAPDTHGVLPDDPNLIASFDPWDLPKGHAWANYPTYHDAATAWAKALLDPHGPYAKATTLREFILIYAPPGDGNDVNLYLSTICREIDALPPAQPLPNPPVPPPSPPPHPDAGRKIADCAIAQLGKPYVWGTHGPATFDCSGLVAYCAKTAAAIVVSPDSHVQYVAGVAVPRNMLAAGDILCYDTQGGSEVRNGNTCSHVGIFIEPGVMVNALNPSAGVIKSDPFDAYFAPLFLGARRLTTQAPPPPPGPVPIPTGLIQKYTANHQPRTLGPSMIRFLVHHITDDMRVSNVISWFQNPTSKASSTFVIDRNGTAYQFMSTLVAPWTNGDVNKPRTDIPALTQAIRQPYNLNEFCVTIEYVGTPAQPPTDAQYVKGIEIAKYVVGTYHVPPHRYGQLRHADIDSVNRPYCPGPKFDLARIIVALGGDPEKLA